MSSPVARQVCTPTPLPLSRINTSHQTRSGKTFAAWDGPHVTVPNEDFNLKQLLQEAISREEVNETDDETDDETDAENGEDHRSDTPAQQRGSSDELQASGSCKTSPSTQSTSSAGDRRRARFKAQSHAHRSKKRQELRDKSFSHHAPKASVISKYITTATPIATSMSTADAPVTRNAFIGKDDRTRSQKAHALEELVGEGSLYKFRLQRWDGKYVCTPV